jgi:hypothetical protein
MAMKKMRFNCCTIKKIVLARLDACLVAASAAGIFILSLPLECLPYPKRHSVLLVGHNMTLNIGNKATGKARSVNLIYKMHLLLILRPKLFLTLFTFNKMISADYHIV